MISTKAERSEFHSEWNSYRAAKYRCSSPNASDYKYYGGRGIEFRFDSFQHFLFVLGRKPASTYTLEREDVNGHYEPGNVKWATRKEQMNNMRRNRLVTAFGRTQTFIQWVEETGLCSRSLNFRITRGWCESCTFNKKAKTCTHGYDRTALVRVAQRNRKDSHFITARGKTLAAIEWHEISGIKYTTILRRIDTYGWCSECAVTLPKGNFCEHRKNKNF